MPHDRPDHDVWPRCTSATSRYLPAPSTGSRRGQLADPSLLPGWTRAHVVAHLALNADGPAGRSTGGRAVSGCPSTPPPRPATPTSTRPAAPRDGELRERFLAAPRDRSNGSPPRRRLGRARSSGRPAVRLLGRRGPAACAGARSRSTTPTSAPATPRPTGRTTFATYLLDSMARATAPPALPRLRPRPGPHLDLRRRASPVVVGPGRRSRPGG